MPVWHSLPSEMMPSIQPLLPSISAKELNRLLAKMQEMCGVTSWKRGLRHVQVAVYSQHKRLAYLIGLHDLGDGQVVCHVHNIEPYLHHLLGPEQIAREIFPENCN